MIKNLKSFIIFSILLSFTPMSPSLSATVEAEGSSTGTMRVEKINGNTKLPHTLEEALTQLPFGTKVIIKGNAQKYPIFKNNAVTCEIKHIALVSNNPNPLSKIFDSKSLKKGLTDDQRQQAKEIRINTTEPFQFLHDKLMLPLDGQYKGIMATFICS